MKTPTLIVAIYLKGEDLNPDHISSVVGIQPSRSQHRGEKLVTKNNRELTAKIGLWALIAENNSAVLSEHLDELFKKLQHIECRFNTIESVQDAYVDIFVASSSDEDGDGNFEFQLSEDEVKFLVKLGLSIRFTITYGKD